jgi:pimeloyl-ACP methyl ester carboxylesterase
MTLIARSEGNTGRAVVAFTGIGLRLGGIHKFEFRRSFSVASAISSVYYVVEKKMSWYERTYEVIASLLVEELARFDAVTTLGNSMGGFGAVLFAGDLPKCRRAVSFTPQYSMAPHVVGNNESRWQDLTQNITSWRFDHALVRANPAVQYFIFSDDNDDRWHCEQFRRAAKANLGVYTMSGASHGLALNLSDRKLLALLVDGLLNQEWEFRQALGFMHANGIDVSLDGPALELGSASRAAE